MVLAVVLRVFCINRIRLEFKAYQGLIIKAETTGINRIRLEFKVSTKSDGTVTKPVLIESDWNLKELT